MFPDAPEYAVLIKGAWGSGKSWFITKSLEELKKNDGKYIYVSLYGVTSYEEIEDAFFKQLHPVLSSKGMALSGKIVKGLLKATLKIDLDNDGKADGSVTGQVPDINLPEYLKNTEGFVLVFDDLERSSIKVSDVLGYINHFVEHQGYKAVVIANEDEILKREEDDSESDTSYRRIKEKLIGKTFEVKADLTGALEHFIKFVHTENVNNLYKDKKELIMELYTSSEYNNLRHLKQALWDFERLYQNLPEEAKDKHDLLNDLLQLYLIYSFEIKSGSLLPKELRQLRSGYYSGLFKKGDSDPNETIYKKISTKYPSAFLHESIIEESLWEDIFDKGLIDKERIGESIKKSSYFNSEKTPDWVRLWHALELTDSEFEGYFTSVKNSFDNKEFDDLGVIRHVVGLFLWLSDIGIYTETKKEILDTATGYIDHLKNHGKLSRPDSERPRFRDNESYAGLQYFGLELPEFKEFCSHIDVKLDESRIDNFPDAGMELLDLMAQDTDKFLRTLILSNHEDNKYYETPILKYVEPAEFVARFMLLNPKQRRTVGYAIEERYKYDSFLDKLKEEEAWLKSVKTLLVQQQQRLKGKISGYVVGSVAEHYIDKAIERLA